MAGGSRLELDLVSPIITEAIKDAAEKKSGDCTKRDLKTVFSLSLMRRSSIDILIVADEYF